MSERTPTVTHVFPDKIGGVTNLVENLLTNRAADGFSHQVVLTHNVHSRDTRFGGRLKADRQVTVVDHLPNENIYSALRRLRRAIPMGPGVLVAHDWLELAMATAYDSGKTVFSLVHGDWDYYYDLAVNHESVIHGYIAYSRQIYSRLLELLPDRRETIYFLPYGVNVPGDERVVPGSQPRLLFVGRMTRNKGILDLPNIDRALCEMGIEAAWTLQGSGPDEAELRAVWGSHPRVRWCGVQPMERVLALYREHDALVLPCRFEGLPVALLEAMAAGCVPVISDLASGVRDVVNDGHNGFRVPVGDARAFARAVATLMRSPERHVAMSREARRTVVERFDARERTRDYQALFSRFRELYRPWAPPRPFPFGSRLDKRWLPNALVRPIRTARRLAGFRIPAS
ncbi:MAG TPA: glycosyltransferase family 4 protein [Thermoanaerobaculaceae bacterium]|nr:glycosyltransferase family 4 protein [Thermoanaerobaculaceae bacterium]